MPNGKLHEYYWRITTFLAERSDDLGTEHSAFVYPDEDEAEIRGRLKATIVFRDGSRLVSVQVSLRGAQFATKQSRFQVGDCFAKNARNDTGLNGYLASKSVRC